MKKLFTFLMALALIASTANAQELRRFSTQKPQGKNLEQKIDRAENEVKPANTQPQMIRTQRNTSFNYVPFTNQTPQRAPAAGMVNVTLTAGDVWGDGTGYQLLLDATATLYGTTIPVTGVLAKCGVLANYNAFSHKIPTNADPVCTTSNIVVNNSITIQIPAGTYDFCIVNPSYNPDPTYSNIWIVGSAGNTSARADNFVFQEGKKYTFVITFDGTYDGVNLTIENDIATAAPAAVTNLTVTPNGTTQATISWTNPTQTYGGAALTSLTSVQVFVNDGTTPVYTNSSPVIGGTDSYIYNIPTPGGYKFTVVASNAAGTGAGASVTRDFCDIITTFPWSEGFEGTYPPGCWTPYQNAFTQSSTYAAEGTKSIKLVNSSTYKTYGLITPPIAMQAAELSFKILMDGFYGSSSFYNTVRVKVSTTDNQVSSFTTIKEYSTFNYSGIHSDNVILTTSDLNKVWYEAKLNLSVYAGQTIYVAIEAYDHYGADFYIDDVKINTFSANDAAITAITAPVSGTNLTATEQVTVTIKNNGTNPITSLPLSYTINGGTAVTETYTGNLASGATANYTFTQTADLSVAGDYIIVATANLPGDGDPTNDSKTITVTNIVCNIINSFPFTEGFESTTFPPDCWTAIDVDGGGSMWVRYTVTVHSGSGAARHSFSSAGMQEGWLITPSMAIPASGNYVVEFWSLNNYISDHEYGGVWVSTTNTNVASFTQVKQLSGAEISTEWKKITVSLSAYAGQNIYIGFKYMGNNADAWIIDDVKVLDFADFVDAEISAITAPVSGINLSNAEQVKVTVKNNGSAAITGFSLKLELNGQVKATETFTGTIASLSQANYTFTQTLDLSAAGSYQIKVTVTLTGDQDATNDSKTINVANVICANITTFPWTENFDDVLNFDCWQALGGDIDGYSWFTTTFIGETDGFAASFSQEDFFGWLFPLYPDNWLVSPKIILGNGNYTLSFKASSVADAPYNEEKYSVLISTTGTDINNDFTEIYTEVNTDTDWKTVTLPLNSYAGQSIYIAFRHWDSEGYALILDDVSISGGTNIPNVNGNEINIFQNNGINVIVSEKSDIRIFDMLGKVLGNYKVDANSTLKVYQPAGIYLIEVRSNGGVSTHKVVVK